MVELGLLVTGKYDAEIREALVSTTLNQLAKLEYGVRQRLRLRLLQLLSTADSPLFKNASTNSQVFIKAQDVHMNKPVEIPEFTDFSSSNTHIQNMSRVFNLPVPPKVQVMPMGYNARTSSVVLSGTPVPRPHGIFSLPGEDEAQATLRPTRKLDFEVELGIVLSQPLPHGQSLNGQDGQTADQIMRKHVFGFLVLNDWSARDVQAYEMIPTGPFHGKSFTTSISPWIVPLESLEDDENNIGRQHPLSCLSGVKSSVDVPGDKAVFDIDIDVTISRNGSSFRKITRCNLKAVYWSPVQLIKYQASSGCGFRTGDILGTGTLSVSGGDASDFPSSLGCLQEITEDARKPLSIQFAGQDREDVAFLEDGDLVTFEAWAKKRDGSRCFGFGSVSGRVMPSS
ncbi:hypothetical protein NW760_015242 [Fusarium oxysporum]|nr:hypothetical protein NW769_015056 [Fusarium oxysporum]KAJ4118639.1 hypothetical protein NW765_017526 [Fusarium oxysporum]KAJ4212902.1 hypothetical protein NW760_015242 [Fusarium oxysporum]KAJ4263261.1 hypothetical protein NW764_016156 [Fusarium oxysporum]